MIDFKEDLTDSEINKSLKVSLDQLKNAISNIDPLILELNVNLDELTSNIKKDLINKEDSGDKLVINKNTIQNSSVPLKNNNLQYNSKLIKLESVQDLQYMKKDLEDDNISSESNYDESSTEIDSTSKIARIKSENVYLNNFIRNFCTSLIEQSQIENIYNEISNNQDNYENNIYKLSIIKFRICNYLGVNDKIYDNFFENGAKSLKLNNLTYSTDLNFFKLPSIIYNNNENTQLREIIHINLNNDKNLKNILHRAKNIKRDNNFYINLIQLIINEFGIYSEDYKFNKFMRYYSQKNKTNIIKIGDVRYGLDRHKSLLFKYLCDQLNIGCCVVRSNYVFPDNKIIDNHFWNLIYNNKCVNIVDFKLYPGQIVKASNEYTKKYYKSTIYDTRYHPFQ